MEEEVKKEEEEEEKEKSIGEIAEKYLKTPLKDRDTKFGIITKKKKKKEKKKKNIIILGKHMLLLKIMTLSGLMMVQY